MQTSVHARRAFLGIAFLIAMVPCARRAHARGDARGTGEAVPELRLSARPGDGLTAHAGATFSLNLRSRIQVRYQLAIPREDAAGRRALDQLVNIGTARLWLSGHVYDPSFTYMIQLALAGRDYRDGATSPIYDAYVDWRPHRDFNLRAGQYFVPFDRLRTVREWALQMTDRPQAVWELTLDRDVGATIYSNNFLGATSPLAWRLSAFGGGGTNLSAGREPGGLLVGRVELRPLGPIDDDVEGDLERLDRPRLALGFGLAHNANTNRARSTTGPTYQGGTTDYRHAAVDLVGKWRGAMLQAEYLWKQAASDVIESTDAAGGPRREPTRSGRGLILQASYVFAIPFELVARYTQLRAEPGTDPAFVAEAASRGEAAGLGMNYYFNGHRMKAQASWIARMPPGFEIERADHYAVAQLDATF